jgi:hypothetical protein
LSVVVFFCTGTLFQHAPVDRPGDVGTAPLIPPTLPAPRRGGGQRVDAWIVMALVVATTALAIYDTYVLLTLVPR